MQELLCNFFYTKVKNTVTIEYYSIHPFVYLLRVLLLPVNLNAVEKNSLEVQRKLKFLKY